MPKGKQQPVTQAYLDKQGFVTQKGLEKSLGKLDQKFDRKFKLHGDKIRSLSVDTAALQRDARHATKQREKIKQELHIKFSEVMSVLDKVLRNTEDLKVESSLQAAINKRFEKRFERIETKVFA